MNKLDNIEYTGYRVVGINYIDYVNNPFIDDSLASVFDDSNMIDASIETKIIAHEITESKKKALIAANLSVMATLNDNKVKLFDLSVQYLLGFDIKGRKKFSNKFIRENIQFFHEYVNIDAKQLMTNFLNNSRYQKMIVDFQSFAD